MFTSINALRSSSAQQDRVTKVENWLKKRVPAFAPGFIFPVALIAESNSRDDFDWVMDVRSTHTAVGFVNGKKIELHALDVADHNTLSKAKRIEAVEAAVSTVLGSKWTWQDGMWPTAETAVTPASGIDLDKSAVPTEAQKEAQRKSWPFPTGEQIAARDAAKPKKAPKAKAAVKKPAAKKAAVAKPGKAKKEKPVKLNWLTHAIPAKKAKVSTNEAAKQRKLVAATLETLIKSGHVEGGIVKGKKGTVVTIVL
jgi:hypothetical protein